MIRSHTKYLFLLLCLCLLWGAFGCASVAPYRAHPEFEMRTKNIKISGLLSPDIKIYEFTAGGVRELRDDWCAQGRENIQGALIQCFQEKTLEIKPITMDKEMEEEMEDIYALYRAVSISINTHTYGDFKFPEKMKNFDYSIGPIDKIMQKHSTDALIFVYGFDEISTGGRKALQAVGVIAGALTGVVVIPRSGITVVSAAMVDPSGTILWYNIKGSQGGYDLRNPESSANLIRAILADYPGVRK
jgi:hypothetical protein